MRAMNAFATALTVGGDDTVVSFGSGDSGGRTQAIARGQRSRTAGAGQVSSLRGRIRRSGIEGRSAAARERRALLARIDAAASRQGNVRLGVLSDIADELNRINSRRRRGR